MVRGRKPIFSQDLADDSGVNLTPLIDVVFVVLILFILVAPMLDLEKIQLASGPNKEKSENVAFQSNSIVLHVDADDSILINKQPIEKENLLAILRALHLKNPKLIPQLFQDKRSSFGAYQAVKNAASQAGFEELDLILESEK